MLLLEAYVVYIPWISIPILIGVILTIIIGLIAFFCKRKHKKRGEDISLVNKNFTEDKK